jgi:hypothetical protein
MAVTSLYITPQSTETPFVINHVSLEQYSAEPVMADDGVTVVGTRYSISGTGVILQNNWGELQTKIGRNSERMISITMTNPTDATKLIDLQAARSNIQGPFCKLNGTQVVGSPTVFVRFDINDQVDWSGNNPILAHYWTQRMALDATGRITRTISGALKMARSSANTTTVPVEQTATGWASTAPWADLFRRAILPTTPGEGWRREAQDFALDASSTMLIYSVTDKQYLYDLPDGCRVGDMNFTYERSAEDPGVAHLSCTVELEGDLSLKQLTSTTGNRHLVTAAVALSKQRIDAANFQRCIITRMRVTERNILSGFSIVFELEATAMPPSNTGDSTQVPSLASMIGQKFTVTRTEVRAVDPYGAGYLPTDGETPFTYAMVPHYISNYINGMSTAGESLQVPKATLLAVTGGSSSGTINVAFIGGTEGTTAMNEAFTGKSIAEQRNNPTSETGYAELIAHSIATTHGSYTTGLTRLTTMYTHGSDLIFQTQKPYVTVTERIEVSQANKAPTRLYRPLPDHAIATSENWDVSFGKFDTQGQRMYTGVFERTFMLYDAGTNSSGGDGSYSTTNGFRDQLVTNGAATVPIRAWKAPNGGIFATLTRLATDTSQGTDKSVFAPPVTGTDPGPKTDTQYKTSELTFWKVAP